jgi:maltose/maltodextrin transport system substrate-binding protein
MKNILVIIFCLCFFSVSGQTVNYTDLCNQSKKESLVPIHPGVPGLQPFWNMDDNARMFRYAPAFDFNSYEDAAYYTFSAFSSSDNQYYKFTSPNPYAPLTPIWDKLPDGEVYLKVEAVMKNSDVYLSGRRNFYKASVFSPPYAPAAYSYRDAAMKALKYLYNTGHIKDWYFTGKPDHKAYYLYCYSAKILRGIMEAMLMHHEYFKNDTALVIATKVADYLIEHSEPEGAPLEYMPQTYEGEGSTAKIYGKQIIIMEPSVTGTAYLEMYRKTKNKKYFQAAVNIANTYIKTQLSSGAWCIRIYMETGKPASEVLCIPIQIASFLTLMADQYGQKQYLPAAEKAMKWVMDNPVKTYNWTGQFEDVPATKPYQNLTKYEAGWTAWYLFDHKDKDTSYLRIAKELVAFCEDQFVVWSPVVVYDHRKELSNRWHTPSALEQYFCYVPIDASASMMTLTFMKAFNATGDIIYREKAIALANSFVNNQKEDGQIPTFWKGNFDELWINCMIYSTMTLHTMEKELENK